MGFKYQKRIKLDKGIGLNVSKSGVSPSIRTKFGSIGPKGFSLRTGIPGLTYISKNRKNSSSANIMQIINLAAIVWVFLSWIVKKGYYFILRRKELSEQNETE